MWNRHIFREMKQNTVSIMCALQKLAHNCIGHCTLDSNWFDYFKALHQYIAGMFYICSKHSNSYHISGQCDLPETFSSSPRVHWPPSPKLVFLCHSMPAIPPSCVPQCACSPVLWTAALWREPPDTIRDSTNLSPLVAHWPNLSGLLQC